MPKNLQDPREARDARLSVLSTAWRMRAIIDVMPLGSMTFTVRTGFLVVCTRM